MFRIHLHAILFFEFADESWIPQFTGDPKVLATTHQSIAFTGLGCCRNSRGVEVLLLTAGDTN
jgi:hypothetical protein